MRLSIGVMSSHTHSGSGFWQRGQSAIPVVAATAVRASVCPDIEPLYAAHRSASTIWERRRPLAIIASAVSAKICATALKLRLRAPTARQAVLSLALRRNDNALPLQGFAAGRKRQITYPRDRPRGSTSCCNLQWLSPSPDYPSVDAVVLRAAAGHHQDQRRHPLGSACGSGSRGCGWRRREVTANSSLAIRETGAYTSPIFSARGRK